MNVGQALKQERTALARAVAQTSAAREQRLIAAREIAERDGIPLAEAIAKVWAS